MTEEARQALEYLTTIGATTGECRTPRGKYAKWFDVFVKVQGGWEGLTYEGLVTWARNERWIRTP